MTREEMLKGIEDGVDLLELSIIKWKDICKELELVVNYEGIRFLYFYGGLGCYTCALCYKSSRNYGERCEDCVVYESTKQVDCKNTPFSNVSAYFLKAYESDLIGLAPFDELKKEGLKLIRKEIDFLKSLRKEKIK